LKIPNKI